MEKMNTYMINKIFTVPYIDKMIDENSVPDSFFKCMQRYVNNDNVTYGRAISEIYHYMDCQYRNEYYFKFVAIYPQKVAGISIYINTVMVYFIRRYKFDVDILKEDTRLSIEYNNSKKAITVRMAGREDLNMEFCTAHKSKGLQADYVFIINNKDTGMEFPSKIKNPPLSLFTFWKEDIDFFIK